MTLSTSKTSSISTSIYDVDHKLGCQRLIFEVEIKNQLIINCSDKLVLERSDFVATQGDRREYNLSYTTDEQRRVAAKGRVRVFCEKKERPKYKNSPTKMDSFIMQVVLKK